MRSRAILSIGVAGLVAAGCGSARADPVSPRPAADCCQALDYLFEASLFKIDVMRLRLVVDDATASAVRALIGSGPRTESLDGDVAARYMAARTATVDTEFLMSMSGNTFIANTTKAIQGLVRDGILSEPAADSLTGAARVRFGFLHDSGVRKADRIRYALVADTVTTRYVRGDSVLMLDRQVGPTHRAAVLGSYLAPSSDFRRGLLDRAFGR